jgi:hypothetical protein
MNRNRLALTQFLLSLLAIGGLWTTAFLLTLLSLLGLTNLQGMPENTTGGSSAFWMLAVGLAASGVMVIPSAVTSYQRLNGRPVGVFRKPLIDLNPLVPLGILLPVLGIGYLVSRTAAGGFLVPFFHVFAVVLPVLFLIILGARGLSSGSQQRRSGVFGAGLVLGPFLILLAEMAGLVIVIGLAAVLLSTQPKLMQELQDLFRQLALVQGDSEKLIQMLSPFLANPVVFLVALGFVAGFVPLVEELFKPIGVWFLAGRNLSAAEGFVAGALSGAGYAIFESLALSSGGEDWLSVAVVRSGTAIIHILTAAFSGWAIAQAWGQGRYLRLALTYLAVVAVHGLWNGMTLLAVYNEITITQGSAILGGSQALRVLSPAILVLMTLAGFVVLIGMNRAFNRPKVQAAAE